MGGYKWKINPSPAASVFLTIVICGADMRENCYMDDKLIIVDGVLLCYTSDDEQVTIPARVNGAAIRCIGSGALSGSAMKSCVIQEGIQEIHDDAFLYCTSLEQVELPKSITDIERFPFDGCTALKHLNLPGGLTRLPVLFSDRIYAHDAPDSLESVSMFVSLSAEQYQKLLDTSKLSTDGARFFDSNALPKLTAQIAGLISESRQCVYSLDTIEEMMFFLPTSTEHSFNAYEDLNSIRDYGRMLGDLECYRFDGGGALTEAEAALQYAQRHPCVPTKSDAQASRQSRGIYKKEFLPTMLPYFYKHETAKRDGQPYVKIHIKYGHVFLPSAIRVRYNDTTYFVYRRLHLSSNPEMPLVREDVAVFDKNGRLPEWETAGKVYTKYKLPTLL